MAHAASLDLLVLRLSSALKPGNVDGMNKLARIGMFFVAAVPCVTATGCGGSEPEPQTPPPQQQYPQQQYPQQPQQQYPQQPQQQYPQQPQQQYPQQATPAATSATMAQPAPIAFPCQSDAQCVAHRCNVAAGKCAWPCQTNNDCQPGFQCLAPQCVPAMATPPAQ